MIHCCLRNCSVYSIKFNKFIHIVQTKTNLCHDVSTSVTLRSPPSLNVYSKRHVFFIFLHDTHQEIVTISFKRYLMCIIANYNVFGYLRWVKSTQYIYTNKDIHPKSNQSHEASTTHWNTAVNLILSDILWYQG